jgi:hypothetical protein
LPVGGVGIHDRAQQFLGLFPFDPSGGGLAEIVEFVRIIVDVVELGPVPDVVDVFPVA